MNNTRELAETRTRVEQEYDALITELRRSQNRLSAKADKASVLSLPEYKEWFANAKQAVSDIQTQITVKKRERAEARRQSNNWRPQSAKAKKPEPKWISWPNKPGFWWNYDNQIFNVVEAYISDEGNELIVDDGHEDPLAGVWKFIPPPPVPS